MVPEQKEPAENRDAGDSGFTGLKNIPAIVVSVYVTTIQ
jgi:hypothetical protein